MTKRLFSELNQIRFDAGLDWIDKYKGVDVSLVCQGLKPDVVSEVTGKGFTTLEPGDFHSQWELNLFNVVLNYDVDQLDKKKPDDILIYARDPGFGYDFTQAWTTPFLFSGLASDLSVDNLLFSISSISKRVEVSGLLEEQILGKYDTFLDSRVMGGPVKFWREFFCLYQSLFESGMIENLTLTSRSLCLNLFAATFPERFKLMNFRKSS